MKAVFLLLTLLSVAYAADLNLGTFAGGVSFGIANTYGFFNRSNVTVNVASVPSSTAAYQLLQNGTYDFLSSATDNALTRFYNYPLYQQNVTMIAATGENALQIIAGGADINSYEDFRNKTFVVDSPTSGLVFGLRRALAIRNLYAERGDYFFVAVGVSLQRFQAIYNGYATVNGTNVTVSGGVLSVPYSANVLADPNFYQGRVKVIGVITDEILPIASGSYHTRPDIINNTVKAEFLSRFLASIILARKFLALPQNKQYVINIIQTQNSTQLPGAIQLIYNASVDPQIGELDTTLIFSEIGLKNAIFLKETFGGAPYNNTDYNDAFVYGPGRLINYALLNVAQQRVAAIISQFQVNPITASCAYSQNGGGSLTVNNFVGAVKNNSVGACTNQVAVTATYINCTSDGYSPPLYCQYNATTDSLTVAAITAPNANNYRTYTNFISVSDPCGTTRIVQRIVNVYSGALRPIQCTVV